MKCQGELTSKEKEELKGKEGQHYGCKSWFTGNADYIWPVI